MRSTVICIGVMVFSAALAFGQGSAQTSANAKSDKIVKAGSGPVSLESGTTIEAQLQSAVDVKRAKVGDEVLLEMTKAVKQNGQTVIPKGAKLVGRVTEVAKRSKENGTSRLGMVFDRIQGRNLSAPISASIVSVTNVASGIRAAELAESDIFASSTSSGSARSTGGSGGGLLGGVTNTVGGVVNATTQTAGSTVNAATNTVGGTTNTVGNTGRGIRISNETGASGSAQSSSILSAAGRDIRLDKGATIQLQLNSSITLR